LPVSPKMPTVPGWLQPAASSGVPVLLNAAAVRPVSPQARPAAVLATVLTVARWVHAVLFWLPNCTPPPLVSAMTWPPAVAASASGAAARPGVSGPAGDQLVPPSLLAASGEKVRSWLGRNPVSTEPPAAATTRPPLSATPDGVTSRQRAEPAGRANSSQKLLCCAAGPPICTTAQLAPGPAANEVASGGGTGAAGCPVGAGVLPQPTTITPAQTSPQAAAVRRRVAFMMK